MKILSAEQIRQADAYTIAHEPIASIDLMERAAQRFVAAFYRHHDPKDPIAVVCGTGNNGGDGLAISRILLSKGYQVQPYVVRTKEGGSADFLENLARFQQSGEVLFIAQESNIPDFKPYQTIIDALFGSGLSRKVTGLYARVIRAINKSGCKVVAVDIPSGLFVDRPAAAGDIICADETVSLQLPKLSLLMPENYRYVGHWQVVDIGLDQDFIARQETTYSTIEADEIGAMLPPRPKFAHKGTFGHGQLIGGSYGKMGAITLAAGAFVRAGAGLLTTTIPASGMSIMQMRVAEAMVLPQPGEHHITAFNNVPQARAIGLGPGLGQEKATVKAYADFLQANDKPLVLDADALNILSDNPALLPLLPPDTIVTPHPKEFDRLAGPSSSHWQRISRAREFAATWQVVIVLKGAHTAIITPQGQVMFNTTGNPGMATGGSGDVLLGIITSLRAQGLGALQAAVAGTWVHGRAGDLAAARQSMTALKAGDIIAALGDVFLEFSR